MATINQSWKDKYLASLKEQERQERQFKLVLSLLNQATVRVSRIAEGLDGKLDKQLKAMRVLLAAESVAGNDLKMLTEALSGQVKRMDAVKTERAKVIAVSFGLLIDQLKTLNPTGDDKQALKTFKKDIKRRSGLMPEQAILIKEYSELQKQVIDNMKDLNVGPSLWQKLLGKKSPDSESMASDISDSSLEIEENSEAIPETSEITENGIDDRAENNFSLSGDIEDTVLVDVLESEIQEKEPVFSKFNDTICALLKELLQQISVPPMAKENYQKAMKQIDKGLNWYELIATLEQVSIVIISAFDRDQLAFELFLKQLNKRLESAYEFINISRQSQSDRGENNSELRESMRGHVAAMKERVDDSNDLEQLKMGVSQSLDKVLMAMDKHQAEEVSNESDLSQQMKMMEEKIKVLEEETQNAEKKIAEERQRALRDVLTQLPNREAYQIHLEKEYERWQRYNRPLTLVVCDIDHFKSINDNFGHQAGDKVLRIIARSLASRLRKTDFIARFGGEEFVILMPETEEKAAFTVIDNIRQAIASCPFHFKEKPVVITLSFGVTAFRAGDESAHAFSRADKALYQAKESGRNKVVLAVDTDEK